MKYRKKPVVIEAFRLGIDYIPDWFMDKVTSNDVNLVINQVGEVRCASIKTLEGTMTANVGDFVIKGVKGELYPCKADIFEATYEAVDDEESEICCAECKHLMFSDFYGECSKGYKGIVHPDDSCGKGERR